MQLNDAKATRPMSTFTQGRLFSSSMLANSFGLAVSAAATLVTARMLGSVGRGQIAVVTVVASYVIIALGLSLESGVLYYGAKATGQAMKDVRRRIKIIIGWEMFACAAVLFVAIPLVGVHLSLLTWLIFTLGSASTIAVAPVTALDRVQGRHHAATWRPIWVLVGQQAGGLAGLAWGRSVDSYLIASGIFGFLVSILMLLLHRRNSSPTVTSDDTLSAVPCPSLRELVNYSIRGHGGVLLHLYAMRVPLIVISVSLGSAAAGFFSVATALAETIMIVTQSQFAYVLAAASANRDDYSVLKRQLRIGLYSSVAVSIALVPVAWAVSRLLGPEFYGVQLTVILLTPGVIALGLWRLASNDLASRGLAHLRSRSGLVGALVVTALILALVGRYGVNGVAVAASLGYGAMLGSLGLSARAHLKRVAT